MSNKIGWGSAYSKTHWGGTPKKETPTEEAKSNESKTHAQKSIADRILNVVGLQTIKKDK